MDIIFPAGRLICSGAIIDTREGANISGPPMPDGRYASVLLVGYGPFCLVRRHYLFFSGDTRCRKVSFLKQSVATFSGH